MTTLKSLMMVGALFVGGAGPFCATANEAPPTSSAPTIIRLFRVVIEPSTARAPLPRVTAKKPWRRHAHLPVDSLEARLQRAK